MLRLQRVVGPQRPAGAAVIAPGLNRGRPIGRRLAPGVQPVRAGPDAGPPAPQKQSPAARKPGQQPPPQPGGGGEEQPGGGGGGPPDLPPQTKKFVALLVEYGGIYGTAACVLAYFLHIDPFGAMHWSADDALLGVKLYAPLLLFDALVMLPDYAPKEDQADQVSRLFFGSSATLSEKAAGGGGDTAPAAAGGGGDKQPGAPPQLQQPPPLLRLQLALELLQSFQTRANPGLGLPVWQECLVGAVGSLADEMLYRAVALTFLGGWLRDRFFEAGFDDDVALWGGQLMPTSEFSKYCAMGVVAALGIAGFAAKAYQDRMMVERVKVLTADGKEAGEKAESIKRQLIESMGRQNATIYAIEGVKEVSLGVASGLAYVWTGNLGASYAGALLMQLLFIGYQRFSFERQRRRRRAALARMQERSSKVKEAIKAAMAARQAGVADPPAAATADQQQQQQQEEGSPEGSPEGGLDERLTPAARVMLSDLDVPIPGGAAAQAEREADLAEIRAALADPPAAAAAAGPGPGAAEGRGGAVGGGGAPVAARAEADERLAALLSDMMRSPEGRGVVRRFKAGTDGGDGEASGSGGSSGGGEDDVAAFIDELLSDPETKARLVRELEARLLEMGEAEAEKGRRGPGGLQ